MFNEGGAVRGKFMILLCLFLGMNVALADNIDIEAFVKQGCAHCAQAEVFLKKLAGEKPDLKIVLQDLDQDPAVLARLKEIAAMSSVSIRVPAFWVHGQLIIGFSDEQTTGQLIREALVQTKLQPLTDASASCDLEGSLSCEAPQSFKVDFLGHKIDPDRVGLPVFTLALGLLDGFNPCSMWVLILIISLLAPMQNRLRMLAIAGTFVAVEGFAYFAFMAAWLNLFLWIGLSRASEIVIACIALLAGLVHIKDFYRPGFGVSLSIPNSAKPTIYSRIRAVLQAENLWGAMIGTVFLAVLVQIVEFLCTSGFPALYTRILTLKQLNGLSYYGYLLLYNLAYMLDDLIVLTIGVITLSQARLQEKQGRWLKLLSGVVMSGLGLYLIFF